MAKWRLNVELTFRFFQKFFIISLASLAKSNLKVFYEMIVYQNWQRVFFSRVQSIPNDIDL